MVRDGLAGLGLDCRLAVRRLSVAPAFFCFAVLSIGVSLGAATAVYATVEFVFWPTRGIADPARVMLVAARRSESSTAVWQSAVTESDFEHLRSTTRTLSALCASRLEYLPIRHADSTEVTQVELVTAPYFQTLGATAAHGRLLSTLDDDHAQPVAVLSHRHWQRRFGESPAAVGQTIIVGARALEIVGIAPPGFAGLGPALGNETDVWVPLTVYPASTLRGDQRVSVVGRLSPGTTHLQSMVELETIGKQLEAGLTAPIQRNGDGTPIGRRWVTRSIADAIAVPASPIVGLPSVIVALVLLVLAVASTNIANLIVARGFQRRHEMATRRALGASRFRLARQNLAEAMVISMVGVAFAYPIARAIVGAIDFDLPLSARRVLQVTPVLGESAAIFLGAGMLVAFACFGLLPALQLTRYDIRSDLAFEAGGVAGPNLRRQTQLVRWQVAVSFGLFLLAAAFAQLAIESTRNRSGVRLDALALATVDYRSAEYPEPRARRVTDEVVARLAAQPGVEHAAATVGLPFGLISTPLASVAATRRPAGSSVFNDTMLMMASTEGIFATLGIEIVAGRMFDGRDSHDAVDVVVVSESAARSLCVDSDIVGCTLQVRVWPHREPASPLKELRVIGVVRDTDVGRIGARKSSLIYVPLAQHYEPDVTFIARGAQGSSAALLALRGALRIVDPELPIRSSGPGVAVLAPSVRLASIGAILTGSLALLSLGLATIGLYAILSYTVRRRTRELGVRIAVGASTTDVVRLVADQGFRPVLQGLVLGLIIALPGRIVIGAIVSATPSTTDLVSGMSASAVLIAAAAVACYVPARRAARVDPAVALREL